MFFDIHYTGVTNEAGLPLFHFFTAVLRKESFAQKCIDLLLKIVQGTNNTSDLFFVLPNIEYECISYEALWRLILVNHANASHCQDLLILQPTSFNCFLPRRKNIYHKKRNYSLAMQRM